MVPWRGEPTISEPLRGSKKRSTPLLSASHSGHQRVAVSMPLVASVVGDGRAVRVMASEVNKVVSEEMSRSFEGDFSGIGHGVGLEVHEWPFVGYEYIRNDPAYADRRLEKNMVISVEPQVHAKGLGYLQIEDEFVVTKEGGQRLSTIRRGLWH